MISKHTIELVRERVDIVALIGESVRLTRRGRSWLGLCPFHKEKSPSFHVNPDRGFFHCFGCKESGSAIDFLMKSNGLEFHEAIRELASRAGVEVEETRTEQERKQDAAQRRAREDLYDVLGLAASFFEHALRGGPLSPGGAPHPLAPIAARALAARGLALPGPGEATSPVADALQAFRVGYAPAGWDGLAKMFRTQGVSPVTAERVGLLVPRTSGPGHYDRFRHRLMFAVLDVQGRVVAFSGRSLDSPTEAELARLLDEERRALEGQLRGEPPAKYINSPESPVYTKGEHLFGLHQARSAIRSAGEALLVEGNFDVVALHARGLTHTVAPLGTAFTPAQGKLLRRFTQRITLMFDGDAAGAKATRASRAVVREVGLSARVARLPPGEDPDSFARKAGPQALTEAARSAKGLLEYLIDDALEDRTFAGASLSDQLGRVRAVAQLLADESDPELRALAKTYADQLSSRLVVRGRSSMGMRELERLVERALGPGGPDELEGASTDAVVGPRARSKARGGEVEREILGALLDVPELLGDEAVANALSDVQGDVALAVAALRAIPEGELGRYATDFLAHVPAPIQGFVASRLAAPSFASSDLGGARQQLLDNARKLRRATLLRENEETVRELGRAHHEEDDWKRLLREAEERAKARQGIP